MKRRPFSAAALACRRGPSWTTYPNLTTWTSAFPAAPGQRPRRRRRRTGPPRRRPGPAACAGHRRPGRLPASRRSGRVLAHRPAIRVQRRRRAAPPGTWAEESIELPASVTAGKSKLTVSTRFVSSALDFTEFSYWADSHVAGGLERSDVLHVGNPASESGHGYVITMPTWPPARTAGVHTFAYPDSDQALASAWSLSG